MKRDYFLFIVPALIVVLLDQISKWWLANYLEPHQILSVIPGFFDLVLVHNSGMAFGILGRSGPGAALCLLLGAIIAAIVVIFFFFYWTKKNQKWLTVGLALILGGAVGNLVDRVRFGYVIDFLDFSVKDYHWPAFNLADSAVTIGTLWLLLNLILGKSFTEAKR
ncbi:MAG: signal peptidase II [Deltaproteobacteria bacterium]|nr:signal peptidase II [Deltaproteobacteria bacterium]